MLGDWPHIWPFFSQIVAALAHRRHWRDLRLSRPGRPGDSPLPLWIEESPNQTVVVVDADLVVGSAKMGPNRPGRRAHVATASFLVDPAHQGQGVGRALGEYVVDWARDAGYCSMQFNAVVETNTAAVRLWRSLGSEIVTTVREAFDHPRHGLVGLHVMFQRV